LSISTISKNDIKAIAIGGFDGMHLGHQELFKKLGDSGAILVIDHGYATLTPEYERQKHTKYPLFFYDLDLIRHLDGDEFIDKLKNDFINLEKIVVGYDFRFGKDRKSNIQTLKTLFDGTIEVIDEVLQDSISIHSRYIRKILKDGDIKLANKLLGYKYKIDGKVVSGQGLGKKEFVPTLNIKTKFLVPKEGVYITHTIIDNKAYRSVTFCGHRISTDGSFAVETHILNQNIQTPSDIEIEFLDFLRENKKFDTHQELKKQIDDDIQKAIKAR